MLKLLQPFLWLVSQSRMAILGAVVTTTGFAVELTALAWGMLAENENLYLGMVTYAVMPGVIGGGLALVALGVLLSARRASGGRLSLAAVHAVASKADWRFVQNLLVIVSVATTINVCFFTTAGYEGYHYMDSPEFCGLLCHQVMEPEYTAYQRSPHADVPCVECHIGRGAESFAKAKLNGARQSALLALGVYNRPIEAPVTSMRPANEICTECHSAGLFRGNHVETIQHFAEDETNSFRYTVLNLRIGGGKELGHAPGGIHAHASPDYEVTYSTSDKEWNDVLEVRFTDVATGKVRTWHPRTSEPGAVAAVTRTMDCIDCHNRAGHDFADPVTVLEERMLTGAIDPSIPWIRKEGLVVLGADYDSEEAAATGIGKLSDLYAAQHPEAWAARKADIEGTEAVLLDTWRTYVWPQMKIGWGTYKARDTHSGTRGGCFRCHNEDMIDSEGEALPSKCEICHYVLAEDEPNPEVFQCLQRERSVPIF